MRCGDCNCNVDKCKLCLIWDVYMLNIVFVDCDCGRDGVGGGVSNGGFPAIARRMALVGSWCLKVPCFWRDLALAGFDDFFGAIM